MRRIKKGTGYPVPFLFLPSHRLQNNSDSSPQDFSVLTDNIHMQRMEEMTHLHLPAYTKLRY